MLIRSLVSYGAAGLLVQGFNALRQLLLRLILVPAQLGVWNYSLMCSEVANTFELGLQAAAFRELPMRLGRGEGEALLAARATYFWSSLVWGLVLALGPLGFWLLFPSDQTPLRGAGLGAASCLVFLNTLVIAYSTIYQTGQAYRPLAVVQGVIAASSIVFMVGGAWLGGAPGLLTGGVAGFAFGVAVFAWRSRRDGLAPAALWRRPLLKGLLKVGLPLRLVDYPQNLMLLLDVIFVTRFLGVEALAIYVTAKTILVQLTELMGRGGIVVLTRFFAQAAEPAQRARAGHEIRMYLVLQHLMLFPLILPALYLTVGWLVRSIMPQYAPAVPVLMLVQMVIFFVPQTSLARNVWVLDKRMAALGLSNVLGLACVAAGLGLVRLSGSQDLRAVALAVLLGYAAYNFYVMIAAGRGLWGGAGVVRALGASYGGAAYTAGVVLAVSWLGLEPPAGWGGLGGLLLSLALVWLAVAPLAVAGLLTVGGPRVLFSRLGPGERWRLLKERIGAGGIS